MKHEFLRKIDQLLREIPKKERQEILSDLEEHFTMGASEGKSDAEIIRELGDPAAIAEETLADYQATNPVGNQTGATITRMVLAATGLIFLNLTLVLGPAMAFLSIYIALCITTVAFVLSPLLSLAELASGFDSFLSTFFMSLVLCGVGLLLGIAMIYIGKFLYLVLTKYVSFNMNVIRGRKR